MRQLRCHGLLGQTWRDATYPTALRYVEGRVDDYAVRPIKGGERQGEGEHAADEVAALLGSAFVFNRFEEIDWLWFAAAEE